MKFQCFRTLLDYCKLLIRRRWKGKDLKLLLLWKGISIFIGGVLVILLGFLVPIRQIKELMGSASSKDDTSYRGAPSASRRNCQEYPVPHVEPPYAQPYHPSYPPQPRIYGYNPTNSATQQNYPPPQDHGYNPSHAIQHNHPLQPPPKGKLDRRYSRIADQYNSIEQVTEALAKAGLESSNLIVGIDFTKSNEWTGAWSFNHRSLHHIGDTRNPYEQAISIIGRTLSAFDEDNLIPCFGFGDASTHDKDVFSFYPSDRLCNGFEEALARYREIVPHLRLAGPTSFAPVIEMAMTIVEQSGGQYHVLLIIADGQVTRSVDTPHGQLSSQEQKTIDAIVKASEYPLSIILVGVGDGPWDMMKDFDDNIPSRSFDNFQFVNFTEIMSKNVPVPRKETEFALTALMEIPSQYKATIELNLLGSQKGNAPHRVPLPPPAHHGTSSSSKPSSVSSFKESAAPYPGYEKPVATAPYPFYENPVGTAHQESSSFDNLVCPICLTNSKDMAFGCGHQTCCDCGKTLQLCPICRSPIQTRIRLY